MSVVIDVALTPQIGMGGSSGVIDDTGAAGGHGHPCRRNPANGAGCCNQEFSFTCVHFLPIDFLAHVYLTRTCLREKRHSTQFSPPTGSPAWS